MKKLSTKINTPPLDNVLVEDKDGITYFADEYDIRYLQWLVCKGDVSKDDYKVYDIYPDGTRYEMIFREDGLFENIFTSNTLSLGSNITLDILGFNRKNNK